MEKKRRWDVQAEPVAPAPNPQIKDAAKSVKEMADRINAYKPKPGEKLEFTKNVEINNLKSRYQLMKATFQHQIKVDIGAVVKTKGKYYPDVALASVRDPPLYLEVSAPTREVLDRALEAIDAVIDNPNMPILDADLHGCGPSWRIPVGIRHADSLNLKYKVNGAAGRNLKHIMSTTNTRVHLRGKGSGFIEQSSGQESTEELYLYITGNSDREVEQARVLCEDLLVSVRSEFEQTIPRFMPVNNTSTGSESNTGYNQYAVGTGENYVYSAPAPPKERPPKPVTPPPPPPDDEQPPSPKKTKSS